MSFENLLEGEYSNHKALKFVAIILADFLDDNLINDNRWNDNVIPAFKNKYNPQINNAKEDFKNLDLSSLIQIFTFNYLKVFLEERIFSTHTARNCAFIVRDIRNHLAHQGALEIISDDEKLFQMQVIKKFLYQITHNQVSAIKTEAFLNIMNIEIIKLSIRNVPDLHSLDEITKDKLKNFQKADSKQGLNMDNNADIEDYSLAEEGTTRQLDSIEDKIDTLIDLHNKGDEYTENSPDENESNEVSVDNIINAPLSFLEVKSLLRTMRTELIEKYPDSSLENSILRQSIADRMIEKKIVSDEDFNNEISKTIQRNTDERHFQDLPKIYNIIRRMR